MQNKDDKLSMEKLKEDANLLFPPNDHFGMKTNCGCGTFVYEQERVMCDLGGFEILSHIEFGKPCYNYVRLKQNCFDKYKDISLHYVMAEYGGKKKIAFDKKQQKQQLGKFNYIHSKDIGPKIETYDVTDRNKQEYVCNLTKKLFTGNEKQITYNYFHLNSTEEIPGITEKERVFSESNISDRVNASIGVVFVKGVNGKNYAIMCNHSPNKNIKEVKRIFREDIENTEIINLPQIQYDGNHCTILNKEFLSEMKEFFEKNKNNIGEAINELKQIANSEDLAIKTFPKLYQYRQHEIDDLNSKIENEGIDMDNNINHLPNTDVYDLELLECEPKKRNIGLLIHGWQIALDYTLDNHEKISVIELEKFYNILTKQIDFFDNLIDLQIKNKDKKIKRYSELFDEKKIKSLSKIVENRKKNITRDENGLRISTNKVDQEYIEKRKQEIIDNINAGYASSRPDFISKNIQKEINDYFNAKDFLKIKVFLRQCHEMKKKTIDLEEARKIFFKDLKKQKQNKRKQKQNKRLLCKRTKTPFEGNKSINEETIEKLNSINKEAIKKLDEEILPCKRIEAQFEGNKSINKKTIEELDEKKKEIEIKNIEDGDIQEPNTLPEAQFEGNKSINKETIEENSRLFRHFWNCFDCYRDFFIQKEKFVDCSCYKKLKEKVNFNECAKNIKNDNKLTTTNILNNYNRNQGGVIE